jgi:membrane-associated phospholipid phosphatase
MKKRVLSSQYVLYKVLGISLGCFLLSFTSIYVLMYLFENVFISFAQTLDFQLTRTMYLLRTPSLTTLMFVITSFGADVTVVGVFIIAAIFSLRRRKKEAILFSLSVFVGLLMNFVLKDFFQRLRPDMNPLLELDSYSYPSGHAMNGFVFYGLLAFYLIRFTKKSLLEISIAVVSAVLVILIGLSRIYLGVHYPTDVLAGYMAGFWVVVAVIEIDRLLIRHT